MYRFLENLRPLKDLSEFRFKRWLDGHAKEFLRRIDLERGSKVLDFGCGTGTYTIPSAEIVGNRGKVYAMDIDRGALEKLKKSSEERGLGDIITVMKSSGAGIPLQGERLDSVLLIDVLHKLEHRKTVLDESFRTLKHGGKTCVYPMHLDNRDVIKLAEGAGLELEEKIMDEHILIFIKSLKN